MVKKMINVVMTVVIIAMMVTRVMILMFEHVFPQR